MRMTSRSRVWLVTTSNVIEALNTCPLLARRKVPDVYLFE
jgi:hypothetical protein